MMRGDVFWADVVPRSGSEQMGRRPVIVISNDLFNLKAGWQSIMVVPLSTSGRQARRGPTAVEIPATALGLARSGVALCHQVTTLDRSKLLKRIGALPPDALAEVCEGIKTAMDLP